MSIFPNPMGQAQGLLGKYYDPAEARKQALWSALAQGGLALLSQGPSQTPITFGSTLAKGVKGGILGAQQGQQDYMQQGLLAKNMADAEAERQRQIREDAWRNTDRQRQLEQQQREDEEREKKEAADRAQRQMLENMLKPTFTHNGPQQLPYTTEQQQAARFGLAGNDVASAYQALQGPSKKDLMAVGEGSALYNPNTGQWTLPPSGGAIKPTDDMREYWAAQEDPKFREYLLQNKKAGAMNIDLYGDGNFDKELGKGVAGAYVKQIEAAPVAQATKAAAQQLRTLMKNRGGALDGLTATVAPYLPPGMLPEGANDVVAAQAIVAGLIPKQRVPGSGTTSDFDAKMFQQSLPNIWNKPGANEIIINTTEAFADYQIAQANIITDIASNPEIKNKAKAIREEIARLPDPFALWKQYMGATGGAAVVPGTAPRIKIDLNGNIVQ